MSRMRQEMYQVRTPLGAQPIGIAGIILTRLISRVRQEMYQTRTSCVITWEGGVIVNNCYLVLILQE